MKIMDTVLGVVSSTAGRLVGGGMMARLKCLWELNETENRQDGGCISVDL